MSEWPDAVPVLFVDGPLAGQVHPAPARQGMPAMMLRVRREPAGVVVRAAQEQDAAADWTTYLGLGAASARARAEHDPWPYVHAD